MSRASRSRSSEPPAVPELPPRNRWILLALQLPARPTSVRVKAWRRLQQLGAVAVKHAVYVLPYSAQAVEDFTWLRGELESHGGHATVFAASSLEDVGDAAIVEQFQAARKAEYERILAAVGPLTGPKGRRAGKRIDGRAVRILREDFEQVRARDFFGCPEGRAAEAAVLEAEQASRQTAMVNAPAAAGRLNPSQFKGRTWVTRPRPGVDRFACAWLITRFIDPAASFEFAERASEVENGVAFDMFEDGFRHQEGRCTFEVMQAAFGIDDGAVTRLGELVHDADLKDDRYRAPEVPTIELLVDGLRASIGDDRQLLQTGMTLFDALFEGLRARGAQGRRSTGRGR